MSEKMNRREFLPLAGAGAILAPTIITGCSSDTLNASGSGEIDLPGTVVFASDRGGSWNLFISRFNSESQTQLTHGGYGEINSYPIWADNGQKIIFVSDRSGYSNIYRINNVLDLENSLEKLTDLEGEVWYLELSPTGQFVLYMYKPAGELKAQVHKLDLSSSQISFVADPGGKESQLRCTNESTIICHGYLSIIELDLTTGANTPYNFNFSKGNNDFNDADISAFDISSVTGIGYMSINYFTNLKFPGIFLSY